MVLRSVSGSLNQSVDILMPGGWGLDFWIALQFSGAKAAAQRDQLHMDFEAGRMSFPADYPDSIAGLKHEAAETEVLMVSFLTCRGLHCLHIYDLMGGFRRSTRGCRGTSDSTTMAGYMSSFLSASSGPSWWMSGQRRLWWRRKSATMGPSTFCEIGKHWEDCPSGGKERRAGRVSAVSGVFVFHNDYHISDDIFDNHRRALLPVRLKLLARGRPKRLALICLPSKEDRNVLGEDPTAIRRESSDEGEVDVTQVSSLFASCHTSSDHG